MLRVYTGAFSLLHFITISTFPTYLLRFHIRLDYIIYLRSLAFRVHLDPTSYTLVSEPSPYFHLGYWLLIVQSSSF